METATEKRSLLQLVTKWLRYRDQERQEAKEPEPYAGISQKLIRAAYRNDPLGRFLIEKLRLNSVGFFLLGILAIAFLEGLGLLLYALIPTLSASALMQYLFQWPLVILFWVVAPLLLTFYPWVTRSPGHLFADLYLDGVVTQEGKGLPKPLIAVHDLMINQLSDKRWVYIALGITVAAQFYWITTGIIGEDWEKTPYIGSNILLYNTLQMLAQAIGLYMLLMGVARIIVTIRGLFKLFGNETNRKNNIKTIHIRPWHPDKCGGLGTLSKYAVRISYFIALLGFWLVLNAYLSVLRFGIQHSLATDTGLWISVIGYVILAPIIFFLTLGSARHAMLRSKAEHLRRISEQLDTAYKETWQSDQGTSVNLSKSVQEVKLLNELYILAYKFPVWPFDFTTLRRFVIAWIAPFLPIGISYAAQFFIELFSL